MKLTNSKNGGGVLLNKAFTLVELLAVIIILSIVALIATPIILDVVEDARISSGKSEANMIYSGINNYCASEDMKYQLDNSYTKICTTSMNKDTVKEMVNLGNADIKEIAYDGERLTTLVIESNNHIFKLCDGTFVMDSECEITTEPKINITYDTSLINSNGWAKEDIAVTIQGNGEIKYCISDNTCEPNEVISNGDNTKFITNEGTTNICGVVSNSLGTSEVLCKEFKLDKTLPNIEGVSDINVNQNANVDLKENVTYTDALSGIDGELIIEPNIIDTTTSGIKEVKYSIKDKAGNIREIIRRITVDMLVPTIDYTLVGENVINSNGWAKDNFYVRATITDTGGGIKTMKSCVSNTSSECSPVAEFSETTKDFYIEVEGNNRVCIEVTDNNDNKTLICSDTYKLDKTAPTIGSININGTKGSNDWYTSDVNISVNNGSDNLSGHDNTTVNVNSITSNTTGSTVTLTTTDLAGNISTQDYTIKVDKDSPVISAKAGTVTITQGDSNPVSNYFNYSYSVSGGNISCSPSNTNSLGVGTQTVSCTVTGNNGLSNSASKNINVNSKFATDSWTTIANNIKNNNTSKYHVGDEKEVTVSGYGTFTVRIANMSTPTECSTGGFSQTACGFVVEFVDIITTHRMNSTDTNKGGWPSSEMYDFVNTTIYNALPSELKKVIINTYSVSGHGSKDSSNFTSTDKLYLLSPMEVWGGNPLDADTANDKTRQLDYYKNKRVTTSYYSAVKKTYQGSENHWWTRTPHYGYASTSFYFAMPNGKWNIYIQSDISSGVAPAFRIG